MISPQIGRCPLDADVLIVGGGIVGVSTAMRLVQRHPGINVLVLEKENALAAHQTGHNSGVVHAGVYYAPGSFKAEFCRRGAQKTYAFAALHNIPAEQCGKLIVATNAAETRRLQDLLKRCVQNGLDPVYLDGPALSRVEPRVSGTSAILVQSSGITDYSAIANKMADLAKKGSAQILTGHNVIDLREEPNAIVAECVRGTFRARYAIVCAGLMADRMAVMCGIDLDFRIVPFRGEYYRLPASKDDIVKHLVYPVPDPELPFLGVHLTRMIGGHVTVGPNAILALAREGYRWRDVSFRDLADMASFGGFWRMLAAHGAAGLPEIRNSLFRGAYLQLCRKYCPELSLEDLQPYPAGVRAQAVMADGTMVHDFLIKRASRSLHVCNAPSPAATSAIPIGEHLVDIFEEAFGQTLEPSLSRTGQVSTSTELKFLP